MRFSTLLMIFIFLPLADMALLMWVAEMELGWLNTLMLVIITGTIGAGLARSQGVRVLSDLKKDLQQGQMPTEHLLSGVFVLIGGAFLLTPGLLTDLIGFLLMIPGVRRLLTPWLKNCFRASFHLQTFSAGGGAGGVSVGSIFDGGVVGNFPGNSGGEIRDADGVQIIDEAVEVNDKPEERE